MFKKDSAFNKIPSPKAEAGASREFKRGASSRSGRTSESSEAAHRQELEDAMVEEVAPPLFTSAAEIKKGKGIQMISSAEEGSEEDKE